MKNKNGNSQLSLIAALMMGVIDLLLVVLLVLSFLITPAKGEELKPNLSADFKESTETYGQMDRTVEYASEASVTYGAKPEATPEPEANAGGIYAGFVFPDSDTVALTDSRIQETVKDPASCRKAVNEIYARHGYAFTKQENIDYFNTYDWYRNMAKETDMSNVSRQFSDIERKNVEKLQAYENAKGWG